MSDLHHILPTFSTKQFSHIIPSLERSKVTVNDLLTLDALEIADHAKVPILDVARLRKEVISTLHGELGLTSNLGTAHLGTTSNGLGTASLGQLRKNGKGFLEEERFISTLDEALDKTLGGGIPTGYLSEVTGESGAGKTQLLLSLLLSVQLSPSNGGIGKNSIYISTEHALPTSRLSQLLSSHPKLSSFSKSERPTMERILTIQTPDLESQDHVLTFQLPVAARKNDVGLIVIDSIAANYRAEGSSSTSKFDRGGGIGDEAKSRAELLSDRSTDLIRTGTLLRNLARECNVAIVVANQVSDRFSTFYSGTGNGNNTMGQQGYSSPQSQHSQRSQTTSSAMGGLYDQRIEDSKEIDYPIDPALTLEYQQRWFTGWGDVATAGGEVAEGEGEGKLKTPSLGLVWTNQLACRIALVKEISYSRIPPSPLPSPLPQSHTSAPPIQPPSTTNSQPPSVTNPNDLRTHREAADTANPPASAKAHPTTAPANQTALADQTEYRQDPTATYTPHHWRRWAKLVFSPWTSARREGSKGLEFEVWEGGIRSVSSRLR